MVLGIFTGLIGILIIGFIWTLIYVNGINSEIIGVIIGVLTGAIITQVMNTHNEKEKEKQELKKLKRRIGNQIDLLSVGLGSLLSNIIESENIRKVLEPNLNGPVKSQDLFKNAIYFRELSFQIINYTDNSRLLIPAAESLYTQIIDIELFLTEPEKNLPKYEDYEKEIKPELIKKVKTAKKKIPILREGLEKIK